MIFYCMFGVAPIFAFKKLTYTKTLNWFSDRKQNGKMLSKDDN